MIEVYGKEGCPACEKAKKLINEMDCTFEYKTAADFINWHPGWRDDDSVAVRAFNELVDGELPFVRIDGKFTRNENVRKALETYKDIT